MIIWHLLVFHNKAINGQNSRAFGLHSKHWPIFQKSGHRKCSRFCCLTTLVLLNAFQKWLHKNKDGYHWPLLVSDGLQNIMNVRMRNFKEIMTLWIKAWNHYDHFPTPKFLRKNKLRFTDFGREWVGAFLRCLNKSPLAEEGRGA